MQRLHLILTQEWHRLGLNDKEADAVANLYIWTKSQDAVFERVKREGWMQGVEQALAAYKNFNYQLADELILASRRVHSEETEAKKKKP